MSDRHIHSALRMSRRAALLWLSVALGCSVGTDGDSSGVEKGEWLGGGRATNTGSLGKMAFAISASGLTEDEKDHFFTGNGLFNQNWVTAPASVMSRDGLGPTFNARSCSACHFKDGRGAPPYLDSDKPDAGIGLLFRLSIDETDAHGGPVGDPVYGGQLQPYGLPDVPAEGQVDITLTEIKGTYGDGSEYTLHEPVYALVDLAFGPLSESTQVSPRVAPSMIGLGLLEAIPEADLLALADEEDEDGDGISGRPNRVWNVEAEAMTMGRFGWKAEQPTVRQQVAGALLGDMGITSSLFPRENCPEAQQACMESMSGGAPEIDDHLLDALTIYSQTLAVPVRENWDDSEVLKGKALFADAGCGDCHVARHQTGQAAVAALSDQTIWPYTDMLLHDMGKGLADGRPVYEANGNEWRTPPLWGIGRIDEVNGHLMLMHDGRADGFAEAILWHGGEGEAAREAFKALPKGDRDTLIRFLESL